MPRVLTVLTGEELQKVAGQKEPSKRSLTKESYDSIIRQFGAGQGAVLALDEGDNKVTVRSNLRRAAERANLPIRFIRTRQADQVKFVLTEDNNTNGHDSETEDEEDTED